MSTTPRLYLASRRRDGHTLVTAVGTIARATVMQLRTILLQALARDERSLLLDLAGVDHIDDTGLDALRRTAARARLVGGELRLVAPSPAVAERVRTSDLRRHVAVDVTLAGALDTPAVAPLPGLEDPPADWFEQRQPADPVDAAEPDDVDGRVEPGGPLPEEADAADLVDQRLPVPLDEEDYPAGT
ncbi:MAG: STAS domain-containing protein [Streptosporangiales bacterium]|nr:STAS domain-containing protein [Streptosporangiales bacterium]MBO0891120.1 STAS domain-containing protein [Acidothermales bacterium]